MSFYNLSKYRLQSVPHRVLAGKLAAHEVLISILEKEISKPDLNTDLLHKALVAAIALTNHQPDIFDAEDLAIAIKILETQKDPILIRDVLQWLAKCCIMHEMNRQSIVGADVIDKLKPLIRLKNAEVRDEKRKGLIGSNKWSMVSVSDFT